MSTLKENTANADKARVLGFHVAQELNEAELAQVSGGRRPDNPNVRTWIDSTGWVEDQMD